LVGLVVCLGFSFLAVVLVPGLELAGDLAQSTMTLKFVGQQQRHPTVIRVSLESVRDRLGNRAYVQESLDQLRDATAKFDAGLREITAPRRASWLISRAKETGRLPAATPACCAISGRRRRRP